MRLWTLPYWIDSFGTSFLWYEFWGKALWQLFICKPSYYTQYAGNVSLHQIIAKAETCRTISWILWFTQLRLDLLPQMKHFAAQLLAGSIISNAINNETIIVNTIEVYGRKKIVDIHREPFGNKKYNTIPTSLPPHTRLDALTCGLQPLIAKMDRCWLLAHKHSMLSSLLLFDWIIRQDQV